MQRLAVLVAGLALVGVATVAGGAARGETGWIVTDLGQGKAIAINERGQVVGSSYRRGAMRATLWQQGKAIDLGTLGGKESGAVAINERGQVVGWSDTRRAKRHAFLWENGKMRDLGTLGGASSGAVAINERGQVVGSSRTRHAVDTTGAYDYFVTRAFLWEEGTMRDLGTLGGRRSAALDVNDRGQVVGWSTVKSTYRNGEPVRHAFLYEGRRLRDLGVLRGDRESAAVAVNEAGQILASSFYTEFDLGTTPGHNTDYVSAFVWQDGRRVPVAEDTFPRAISEQGQVVGEVYPDGKTWMGDGVYEDDMTHALSWTSGKTLVLSWDFSLVTAVSEQGHVVGFGLRERGDALEHRAFVWQERTVTLLPVPPGGRETLAFAVNEQGQVVGYCETKGGGDHAVLWTLRTG